MIQTKQAETDWSNCKETKSHETCVTVPFFISFEFSVVFKEMNKRNELLTPEWKKNSSNNFAVAQKHFRDGRMCAERETDRSHACFPP